MIKTHGLNHISLDVKDPDISLRFYEKIFGVKEYFRDKNSIQVLGPGEHDVLAFVKADKTGIKGGINHFGFRLRSAADIEHAISTAKASGAIIKSTGEFSPGFPYLFLLDPDGNEIEIWYE